MEKDNFISVKTNKITSKRTILYFIGIIKFISLIIIIKVHLYGDKKHLFYAVRACELLFVSSGFLVGYNYIDKNVPNTFIYAFQYYYKHLRTCYPLYLLNFLYGIISHKKEIKFDINSIELFLINIFMLQVWSRHRFLVSFYNGISWFLHDLLICYFISPLLFIGINSNKKSLIIFIVLALTRIALDTFLYFGAFNIFDTNLHNGPIVRIFEFYLGMLIVPSFLKFKSYFDNFRNQFIFKIIFTIIPILTTVIFYSICSTYNDLLRCYYILIFCVYIP